MTNTPVPADRIQRQRLFLGQVPLLQSDPQAPTSADNTEVIEGTWQHHSKTWRYDFPWCHGGKEEVTVKPIGEQDEWESRRLWCAVAKGIREAILRPRVGRRAALRWVFSGWLLIDRFYCWWCVCIEQTTPAAEGWSCCRDDLATEAFRIYWKRSSLCVLSRLRAFNVSNFA